MLQIGNVGLTVTEQYTHMSMWCIAGAPLLAGTDVVHASNQTLAILANQEVTAINQDLGKDGAIQGRLMTPSVWNIADGTLRADLLSSHTDPEAKTEVWCKMLADGNSAAVALLNLGDSAVSITASWKILGLPPAASVTVRDLWAKKTIGTRKGGVTAASVPSHGTALLKLTWV
eukprot:SAG31_NODE_770_length_12217_cov_2.855174_14_plen_174_part_00